MKSRPIPPPPKAEVSSLIARVNPLRGRGQVWARKMTALIPIFRNEINAVGDFREGVNISSVFTGIFLKHVHERFEP